MILLLLLHTCPGLEDRSFDVIFHIPLAVIGVSRAVTLACLTPGVGVASPFVSRPQAFVGTTGQSIILIHVGFQSQIRGGLWHYKRLWLKFIQGLFDVQG